jgi:hypothetical protein
MKILRTAETSNEWKQSLIIKIHKKVDVTKCKNWRGITLLSVQSKILSRIILNRIKNWRERKNFQEKKQDFEGTHQINTLLIIIEQSMEYLTNLYLVL